MWIDGNITREGITADLEAMQRAGLGGVLIMEVDRAPAGPVAFGSPAWRELFKHAVAEAGRLGLEVNMNNDPAGAAAAARGIRPTTPCKSWFGPKPRRKGRSRSGPGFPQPETTAGCYRDIAVLAFPTPPADADPKPGSASNASKTRWGWPASRSRSGPLSDRPG